MKPKLPKPRKMRVCASDDDFEMIARTLYRTKSAVQIAEETGLSVSRVRTIACNMRKKGFPIPMGQRKDKPDFKEMLGKLKREGF